MKKIILLLIKRVNRDLLYESFKTKQMDGLTKVGKKNTLSAQDDPPYPQI